jgi:hypothetical protein
VISAGRAIGLADEYRRNRQGGMSASEAWVWLRNEEPDANVFERRRIEQRGEMLLDLFLDIDAGSPPASINLPYPLPPSTEAPKPYLIETVWLVNLDVGGIIRPRTLVVDIPNGSLWTTILSELEEAVMEMASDYDAEDEPDIDFLLTR